MRKITFLFAITVLLTFTGCTKSTTFFSSAPLEVRSSDIFNAYSMPEEKIAVITATTQEGNVVLIQDYNPSEKLTRFITSLKRGEKIHVRGEFTTCFKDYKNSKISDIVNLSSGMIYRY